MRIILSFTLLLLIANLKAQFRKAIPPIAEKKEHWRVIHGDSVLDNYYWMYDFFGKGPDSTKVINYLKSENAYLDTVMSATKKLQNDLFVELRSRIKEKDESVPVLRHGYYYYTRAENGKQYFKYCRKKGSLNSKEEVLLDVDQMAEGHPYFEVTEFQVSADSRLLAYAVDEVSRRQYKIHVKNLETGQVLEDVVPNTNGNSCWASDNKTLFYTENNPITLLSEKIKRHTLGTVASKDVVVYDEKDKSNYIAVGKSKNEKYIFISSFATLSSEIRLVDANNPTDSFRVFQPRLKDVLYNVIPLADQFLILTNKDGAKNFKLMKCSLSRTDTTNWKEVIPHRTDVLLQNAEEFKNYVVLEERKNGLVRMRVRSLSSPAEHYLNFGEAAYAANFSINAEYNSTLLRYSYTSLTTPRSIYDYNMSTKAKKLLKQEVVGGYSVNDYVTERLYVVARDSAKIPVSLVYKKGFKKNGNSPLMLVGYGSYGVSTDAEFNSNRLSLINRGFIYAIAHIRGGQEMGRYWYEDGKMMKKKNTFTDFIDCAEFLVKEQYTSPKHLYAQGTSAGGLLMGAIVNLAPHLWNGVVARVPFVDVVNTMLDESIPLTTNEFDEWGNPRNKDAYWHMKSYSPYENVEKKSYPNILVTTGLHDSQVQYFEPAKWVAKMREFKNDSNLLLFNTNMAFGHGGASGRFDYLKEVALIYAFLLNLEGLFTITSNR